MGGSGVRWGRRSALVASAVLALGGLAVSGTAHADEDFMIELHVTVSGDVMDGTLIGSDHWCRDRSVEIVLGARPDASPADLDRQFGQDAIACHAVTVVAEVQAEVGDAGVVEAHVCLNGRSTDSFTDPWVERPCVDVATRVGVPAASTRLDIDDSLHIGARTTVQYWARKPFTGQSIAVHTDDVVRMSVSCVDGVGSIGWEATVPAGATRNSAIVTADNYERQGPLERRTGSVDLTDVREEFVGTALTLDLYQGSARFTPGRFPVPGDWLSVVYRYTAGGRQFLVFPAAEVPAECGPAPI